MFKELGYSSVKDTKETVAGIRSYNADYRVICPREKKE